jgi:hypothetical protein
MLQQILEIVKENAGDAIINNNAIPNKKNNAAIKATAGSMVKNLKKNAGSGNLESIMEVFHGKGDAAANPAINQVSGQVAGDLMKKFGLDQKAASGIVQQLLPVVMKQLVKKANDPKDSSIDLQDILGTLTKGSKGGGILGQLKGLFR